MPPHRLLSRLPPVLTSLLPALFAVTASAGNGSLYQPLAGFPVSVKSPEWNTLTLHPDGNLYGANSGLSGSPGLIFKITPDGSVEPVARLTHEGSDAITEHIGTYERLELDTSGRLWGISYKFSNSRQITCLFYLTPATGRYVEVTTYDALPDATAPVDPRSNLIPDGQGNFLFLATMADPAAGEWQTVLYRLEPLSGTFTKVGAAPSNEIEGWSFVADGEGYLWATSRGIPNAGKGWIFKINAATGAHSRVAGFSGGEWGAERGELPIEGLSPDGQGFLWGTTLAGGLNNGGTIFKIRTATGKLTTVADLAAFQPTGQRRRNLWPIASLCADGKGWMWGATATGGVSSSNLSPGSGMIFKVNILTGEVRAVVMLTGTAGLFPGAYPATDLILAPDGKIRGMTKQGGAANLGTVFAIDPETDAFTLTATLTGLEPSGSGTSGLGAPDTSLTADDQGRLWGGAHTADFSPYTTSGHGALYTLDPRTGGVTRRLLFTGRTEPAMGSSLDGGLARDSEGGLWGFTRQGGGADRGTVFRLDPASGALTTIREFTGDADGHYPVGPPLIDSQGYVWGTTRGTSTTSPPDFGTVFKIHAATGAFTTVTTFTGATGATPGSTPNGVLARDGLGHIWGTTYSGGEAGKGTLFRLDTASGALTSMAGFGNPEEPAMVNPGAGPALDGLGFLWGTTNVAGSYTESMIYKVNASTGTLTRVGSVPGYDAGSLVYDGAGWLWGTAGRNIFKTAQDTQRTVILHSLTGLGGQTPGEWPSSAPLLKHTDGHFYGVAQRGGVLADGSPAGGGQIFRLHIGPLPRTLLPASVSATTARIPGTVHSNDAVSQVFLDYSTDAALAGSLTVPVTAPTVLDREQPVTAFLRGLEPATTYHYRLRALNPDNANPQTGETLSFTTPARGLAPWLAAHGLTGAEALPNADPDADGLPNALEYTLGADPRQPSPEALPRLTGLDSTGGGAGAGPPALEFHRAPDAAEDPGISLAVETSTDLTRWQSLKVGKTTADSGPGVSVESSHPEFDLIRCPLTPAQAGKSFVRLRAVVSGEGEGEG